MTHEKTQDMAYLGPHGTHSEEACNFFFSGNRWRLYPYSTIDACIRAVAEKKVSTCFVPIENSLEGSVNITLDILAHEVELFISREIVWPVRNHLLASTTVTDIKTILSHPQPLAQCRNYLTRHYPHVQLEPVESTAKAAYLAAKDGKHLAAIASRQAADHYHLKIVANDIQDHNGNCTRFVALRPLPSPPQPGVSCKTSVICRIHGDNPGSLCAILQIFARYGVNLVRIESRPARTSLGEYIFFLDMEGNGAQDNLRFALDEVRQNSIWFKNLGSYPCIRSDATAECKPISLRRYANTHP
jgi:prephenate dehydratase